MSEVKHTIGPWVWLYSCDEGDHTSDSIVDFTNDDYGCCYLAGPDGSANSEMFPELCAFVVTAEERPEAIDASLIAAAPELLEACEAALFRLEQTCHCEYAEMVDLRAAIAKAKGEPRA